MENNLQNENENQLTINKEISYYLLETTKWAKFLAIIGYIGIGLLIALALFVMFGLSQLSQYTSMPFPMGFIGVLYIIIAVIHYFPVNYLYKFSVQTRKALDLNDSIPLTSGFKNLKSMFRFIGIFTIVVLSIYILALLIMIPAMAFLA